MKYFVALWIGRDEEAEFHGLWSTREKAEAPLKIICGEDYRICGGIVVEAELDVEPTEIDI